MRGEAALDYLARRPLLCTLEAAESAVAFLDRAGEHPDMLAARRGRPMDGETPGMERRGTVNVIPVTGPIFRYADIFTQLCGGVTTEALAVDITAALDDPMCSAVVLNFDSPGGEATGIPELASLIRAGTDRKPIVAYVGGEMCSAAYWLGAACSEVVMGPACLVGSIGTVMGVTKRSDKPGVKTYEFVSSQSPNKRPDLETEKGRGEYQRIVDDMTAVFIAAVAEYRDTTDDDVAENFGKGGMLVGRKAVDVGMADRIGTLEEVIDELNGNARGSGAPTRAAAMQAAPTAESEGQPMFKLFSKKADGTEEEILVKPAATTETAPIRAESIDLENSPAVKALRAQLDEQKTANAKIVADLRAEKIEASARSFLLAHNDRLIPAESAALKAVFVQLAHDDASHPLPDGKTRLSLLSDHVALRPKHGLYQEHVGAEALPESIRLIGQRTDAVNPNAPPSEARVNELVAKAPPHVQRLLKSGS